MSRVKHFIYCLLVILLSVRSVLADVEIYQGRVSFSTDHGAELVSCDQLPAELQAMNMDIEACIQTDYQSANAQSPFLKSFEKKGWEYSFGAGNGLEYKKGCDQLGLVALPHPEPTQDNQVLWAVILTDGKYC